MFNQKIKKNGQAIVGGILVIFLLIALVVFIFFLIRRPEQPPGPPTPAEIAGIPEVSIKEIGEEIAEKEQNFPITEVLPYGGPFNNQPFFIHDPNKDGVISVDIDATANFEEVKNEVMDWIQYQGYNPDDYDFNFRTKAFPK